MNEPIVIIVPGSLPYQHILLLCTYIMRAADFQRSGKVLTDEQYFDAAYERLKKLYLNYEKYPHPAAEADT